MDLRETPAQRELRAELGTYVAGLFPEDERRRVGEQGVGGPRFREVVKRLGEDGWPDIGWPVEYGGQGRSVEDQYVLFDEVQRAGLPFPFVTRQRRRPEAGMDGIAEGARLVRGTSVDQPERVDDIVVTAGTGVPTSALVPGAAR